MQFSRKWFSYHWLLVVMCALVLVGFAASLPTEAKTKLVVMDWKLDETGATQNWFKQVKETFEAEHPDVEISYVTAPWGNEYREKVLVGSAAGTAPDVVSLSIIWARELWDANALLDLTPYIARTPELHPRNFIPATQLYNQVNGAVYGITNAMDESLLLYDTDAFEQAGLNTEPYALKNWNDLVNALKKLTKVDGTGAITRWGLAMSMGLESYSSWLTANGGSFYNENLTRSGFNSKQGREAAEFLVGLQQSRLVGGSFEERTAAMRYGLNATPYFLDKDAPDINFQVTSFPTGPSGTQRGATVWGNMYSISRTTKNPDLAWEFIKYYASLRGNMGIFKALNYVTSPRLDFYKSKEWAEARTRSKWMPMIPEIAYVGGVYPFLQYAKLESEAWNPFLSPALAGTTAIQGAFEQAASVYDRILREAPTKK